MIGSWVAARKLEEVLEAMKAARVPAGPILSTAEIVAEEQYQQRGMFHTARPPSGEFRVKGLELHQTPHIPACHVVVLICKSSQYSVSRTTVPDPQHSELILFRPSISYFLFYKLCLK